MLRTLAAIYGVITLLAALLVSEPQPVIAPPQPSPEKQAVAPTAVASSGLSVREALFTKQFWQLWFMILFSAGASLNVAAVYKRFAQNAPALHGDQFQALVGGLGALCNGSGRLIWGTLFDLFGFKTCFLALTILQSIIQIIYPYSSTSKEFFVAITCASFFTLAGNFALVPPAVQRIFGPRNGAQIFGVLFSAFAVAVIGGSFLSK
eukprot:gene8341-10692_t